MKEVLASQKDSIEKSDVLDQLTLSKDDYFVLSVHREENVDSLENFTDLLHSINTIAEKYKKRIIFSTHPRTRKRLETTDITFNPLVEFMKPLGFADYIKLQTNAFCVISDSGTITEEASLLGFPAITVRQAHERPEGMDTGTLIMTGLKEKPILDSIDIVTGQYASTGVTKNIVPDYDVENVSQKVVRIIMSYTEYINHTVWWKKS
jgi:UDP-N-acetylglucosamine 2-epimerase (non-hydrolysing)